MVETPAQGKQWFETHSFKVLQLTSLQIFCTVTPPPLQTPPTKKMQITPLSTVACYSFISESTSVDPLTPPCIFQNLSPREILYLSFPISYSLLPSADIVIVLLAPDQHCRCAWWVQVEKCIITLEFPSVVPCSKLNWLSCLFPKKSLLPSCQGFITHNFVSGVWNKRNKFPSLSCSEHNTGQHIRPLVMPVTLWYPKLDLMFDLNSLGA